MLGLGHSRKLSGERVDEQRHNPLVTNAEAYVDIMLRIIRVQTWVQHLHNVRYAEQGNRQIGSLRHKPHAYFVVVHNTLKRPERKFRIALMHGNACYDEIHALTIPNITESTCERV